MTSRKRNNSSTFNLSALRGADSDRTPEHKAKKRRQTHKKRRQNILETLEARQLLAADGGPQLIGIQPNTGELIVDNSIVQTRPRVLTLRFDQDQQIDPGTLSAVQVTRAGEDNLLGTEDDVAIVPGLVSLGEDADNEVVVRFSEALVDDLYKVEVVGYDDPSAGLIGLRNTRGELLQTDDAEQRVDVTRFDLRLGALIEAVVPQPVIRLPDGSLQQNRDEILVHFNDDPLFIENDFNGDPTLRSVENPRFYQLLLTQETVRTSDDALYQPDQVVYDEATNTARLIFSSDLNELGNDAGGNAGVGLEGGTFRLRIGTAVDDRVDLIIPLDERSVAPLVVTDFGIPGLRVTFQSVAVGESNSGRLLRFEDTGGGGLAVTTEPAASGLDTVVVNLGGDSPTIADLETAVTNDVAGVITMTVDAGDDTQLVPSRLIDAPPLSLVAVGETLETAFDVGVFGNSGLDGELTSLVYSESIDAQPFLIEPIGGDDDLGHSETANHINSDFGPDLTAGVTEIAYNFQGIFATVGATSHLNQITETEKVRIREALNLWASEIGVQFRETADEGITFAFGDNTVLGLENGISPQAFGILDASVRIDPLYDVPAMVFDRSASLGTDYGEDLTRKAVAGIGLLLGLERASDLSASTIMSMSSGFLNASIDVLSDNEPVFPGNTDVLHGQYVHRPDSIDIDLYRFEVDLDDPTQTGTLTAESFAERLADSSLLDTSLTLFEETTASVTTDFGLGIDLSVTLTSLLHGRQGNGSRISFVQTDRGVGDTDIRVLRAQDASGVDVSNGILIDLPRLGPNVTQVLASDLVDAINDDAFASSIFRASIPVGDPATDIVDVDLGTFSPLLLGGGGLNRIQINDDYFGEDSRIRASLGEGVYYLGVAASGNDQYDPTISGSGYGGRTQGAYDLHLKFEPQVDETDVIRDRDGTRIDVPGTPIDADGDGVPGGVHNFWFQTRSLDRMIVVEGGGASIEEGQTIAVMGGANFLRTYEFVTDLNNVTPGNIGVQYSPVGDAQSVANALRFAIASQASVTGVTASTSQQTYESTTRDVLTLTGDRSVSLSADFQGVDVLGRTLFVDKSAGPAADGSLSQPFNNIANSNLPNAFGSAYFGDIVRIVGNGGLDANVLTEEDNFSYKIGIAEVGGSPLQDGSSMNVPNGVTTMIDAGAIFKLRNSYINVGSSTTQIDRSGAALQVLGAPRHVQLSVSGDPIVTTLVGDDPGEGSTGYADGSVIFTSMRDRDVDADASGFSPEAAAGNWGGIIYRRDVDRAEGRRDLEDDGIFLQTVNHAEIRYGGGSNVLIDSVQQLVNPIQIVDMRPTVSFNEIMLSADSAISAAPNSFEETSYQAPQFQQGGSFTADYDRVGPDMYQNLLLDNSVNGVFVRVATTPVEAPKEFTVAARFDDSELVHYVAENLVIAGSPGGSIEDGVEPSMTLLSARRLSGGPLGPEPVPPGDPANPPVSYDYKMTFVDANGFESLASPVAFSFAVVDPDSSVQLTSLPAVPIGGDYVSRRLYRSDTGDDRYVLVGRLDAASVTFTDDAAAAPELLPGDPEVDEVIDLSLFTGVRGRLDASLVLDPSLIVKLRGSRIEMGQGTQLLAEGQLQSPVVFTSSLDDRFGAGGTFDTNNDNNLETPPASPVRGDWAGIYAGPTSNVSFDHVQLSYAGGISLLDGGLARGFLPLELQQAEGRITNSRFEFNDQGQDGAGPAGRFGRLAVTESTIMVRGSQPIIVGNTFVDNRGSIIDIDIESMGGNYRRDVGRQTGGIDRIGVLDDNYGPMIRFNRYLNDVTSGLQLSGLEVRAGAITTETTFDDTDIAHLLFDNIEVGNLHSSGGLRLLSRPDESLVVKFIGPGNANTASSGTGITVTGELEGIADRVGGTLHVIGMPGAPVILTSMNDDSVGSGLKPDGSSFTDHDGDGITSRGVANDWNGIVFDEFSNDDNFAVVPELELLTESAPGLNGTAANAQFLGELADDVLTADTVRRLGFEVDGYLSGTNDLDTYSFIGSPGSEVWVDVDRSTFTLDTVIELLDANGNVLARSDNSVDETDATSPTPVTVFDPNLEGVTTSLLASDETYAERDDFNHLKDFGSDNLRDAGLHFPLGGDRTDPNSRSVYFLRVRSASLNPDDAEGGLTGGQYRMQIRLTEEQAFPGSVVRFANIKYANNGIRAQGLMSNSPLLGEAQENEAAAGDALATNSFMIGETLGQGPQYVGNLVNNHNMVIGTGGALSSGFDVDLYNFEIDFSGNGPGLQSTVFDVDFADGYNRPDTNVSVFFDRADNNSMPELVYFGSASNVLDDMDSPLANDPALESLVRGSIANGDPFVGPVLLPEGSYYVAISSDGVVPEVMADAIREPINSIRRIAEDRIAGDIAAEGYSTANDPVVPQLFVPATFPTEFTVVNDAERNHGKPNHFAGVGEPFFPPPVNQIWNEANFTTDAGDAPNFISTDPAAPNDPPLGSFQQEDWSLDDDDDIGNSFVLPFGSSNTSVSIPHVSFDGRLDDAADFFTLTVTQPSRLILDVDGGWDVNDGEPDPENPPFPPNDSVDTKLVLVRFSGLPAPEPSLELHEIGEVSGGLVGNGRDGSNSDLDPFVEIPLLAPGVYFVGVVAEDAELSFTETGVTVDGGVFGGDYTLHVSMDPEDPHVVPPLPPTPGSQVIAYDRAAEVNNSTLTSESFDLAGYSREDLPQLYFNRSYEPAAGDNAVLRVTSDQNPGGDVVHNFTTGEWDQIIVSLEDFAGNTNVQLNVQYTTNGAGAGQAGLRLDDIIIGFAERGETVFEAARGTTFTGFPTSNSGEYQLEVRRSSDFAREAGFLIALDDDFDTNDRHSRSVTMVAPAPADVSDQETFVLGDGAIEQIFEFDKAGDGVTFGNTSVDINGMLTEAEVAEAIRDAINSQSTIFIEASTSGGLDGTEAVGTPTDARVALHGARTGTFDPVTSVTVAPGPLSQDADGNLLMPAILYNGTGDSNFERLQGVVIVEHNEISDVRGVGIWSEPGQRETVPSHVAVAAQRFGEDAPPVGLTHPGAVLNLPEINDSVLGGLAPGILIQSNTLDNAEFAGVKIAGQAVPWIMELPTGDFIADGSTFGITAAGTSVTFEFEEIGKGDTDGIGGGVFNGADTFGGDGFGVGNVPVYYRQTDDTNENPLDGYLDRVSQYSSLEMVHAVRESIQGSRLMTNGMSELVEVMVGPSLFTPGQPALYIEGAEAVTGAFPAPIYEAPQPFGKIVNNTFYGDDGTASNYPDGYKEDALDGPHIASSLGVVNLEPNDFLSDAVETRIGGSHRAPYTHLTTLGDNQVTGDLGTAGDVDFYRVFLETGDRLISDVDTFAGGPDTVMRVFNEAGIPQQFENESGELVTISFNDIAPEYLDPSDPTDYQNQQPDPINERDSFIDFTAMESGVYYIGISSVGNEEYDTRTLSGRVAGADVGTGIYRVTIEALASRSFVMELGAASGIDLNDATYTVTQIEDIPDWHPQLAGGGPVDNRVVFTFGGFDESNSRAPDVMRTIAGQFRLGVISPFGLEPILSNTNYETFYDSRVSPRGAVLPGTAQALGGPDGGGFPVGSNAGLRFTPGLLLAPDKNTSGFGHRPESTAETFSGALGSTEQYVLIENVAKIELSPEAIAAGLLLTPIDDGDPQNGPFDFDRIVENDVDQIVRETGLLITNGASPTALNNVFLNLDDSLVEIASKPQEVIVVGNVFQHAEGLVIGQFPNSENGNDDFNITLGNDEVALQYPEANNFQPAEGSRLIDSSVNSVVERSAMVGLKNAVGLSPSNILAPSNDVDGVLRADNPNYAPPGGIGGQVFKDRGSTELADFNGPVAIAETARDNDAEGVDQDPAISFINLDDGVYREFRIQLRDNGDSSDPFTGIGIDDNTVVVPEIAGLRQSGANVTLIENDRLLEQGIDYTFNYDSTRNLITLTPLAGVWQNDRSYRIEINNVDRDVLIAPSSTVIQDGDQMEVIDSNGGQIVFEFESGYSLLLPEPITLVVPQVGTSIGGVTDGDFFQLNDGVNPAVVFEFNDPGDTTLPGAVPIELPATPTPENEVDKQIFLEGIAVSIRAAIQNEVDNGVLDLDVAGDGVRVVLGAEPGATASTVATGLQQLPRTLALRVPTQGVSALGGIVDGDTFQIDTGGGPVTFEFDTGNGIASPLNRMVSVVDGETAIDTAIAIKDAIDNAGIGLNPSIEDDGLSVYLNLPLDGAASVEQGQLALVGLSRPALDEEKIVITPSDGVSDPVVFEINRTDERDSLGVEINPGVGDGVTAPNIAIDLTRATTGDDFAALVANAIQGLNPIAGLNPADVEVINGGALQIGGEEGLGLAVDANSMEVTGSPSVSGASTVEVAGPLLLSLPLVGGTGILDGSVMVLTADTGEEVIFEFNLNGTPVTIPTALQVPYNSVDPVDTVAANIALVVNAANIGITATNILGGQVSFGRISESRVNINGIFDPTGTGPSAPGLDGAVLKRGIVNDGEVMVISQGATTVSYEFEAVAAGGGVATGNVAVPFTSDSTPGQVALALASTINNNKLGLAVNAVAELDPATGLATGKVLLNDQPGTVVDITAAPTLEKSGVPGGATAIRYSSLFGTNEIKLAMIEAINSVNQPGEAAVTSLSAEDRGGDTFFVTNASLFRGVAATGGTVANFSLPGVQDIAGNKLEANRPDFSTQFTILMPTAQLDFGDAPDPVNLVNGRYPTKLVSNGPRHVVGNGPLLGTKIDANLDGLPGVTANRDDVAIAVEHDSASLFATALAGGGAEITINTPGGSDPTIWDGDTFTLDLGTAQATFEFDVLVDNSGAFDEDHYAVRPDIDDSAISIAEAIQDAINEARSETNSRFNPASVVITGDATTATVNISADDEDGVGFISEFNPLGILNQGVYLPIEVDVTGAGVLEGWIDFNADGDWDDPGEQVLPMVFDPATQALRDELLPVNQTGAVSNIFADTGGTSTRVFNFVVPPTTPNPPSALTTYARFRVSKEGGLGPDGLSLSGEVEDYSIRLLPGLPPEIVNPEVIYDHANLSEDNLFVADGLAGNPAGLLDGITDPDGQPVAIYIDDVVSNQMLQVDPDGPSGPIVPVDAGELTLNSDGTFSFAPETDFNGEVTFTARVTDQPVDPTLQLVNSTPLTVTLNVSAVNDAPVAIAPPVVVAREINEDEPAVFNITDIDPAQSLIDGKYIPGNVTSVDEMDQTMKILEAGTLTGLVYLSDQGGNVTVSPDGSTITYTPPENYNGNVPPGTDSFTYLVIDEPGGIFTPQQSADVGTVNITFVAVNDPPEAVDDTYNATENADLVIPLTGSLNGVDGIFNNDNGGPSDEDQNLTLKADDFPQATLQGGTVTYDAVNAQLTYSPLPNFSGTDEFTYTAVDDGGLEDMATVTLIVAGIDDSPVFLGVNGQTGVTQITRDEAKAGGDIVTYDLNTWFSDPEGASLTFTSSTTPDPTSLFSHSIAANVLSLDFAAFESGSANLTVNADDGGSTPTAATILVTLNDTPDGPLVITAQDPFLVTGIEDTQVTQDMSVVFSDPDGDAMIYHVTQLGTLINPTTSQIQNHELVQVIEFVGDEMRITLQPDQHGAVTLTLEADDQISSTPNASHDFLLTVTSEPDFPVAVDDAYGVPIGSALQVTNISEALLGNDYDPDGDAITFNSVVVNPTDGSVVVNADGTFTYTNAQGTIGGTDTFTYKISDSTGRESNDATVTITFEASAYQNPIGGFSTDVNADGFITALDALRIINFLQIQGGPSIPVSSIGSAPPDYLDTNGNGAVTVLDALEVLNVLAQQGGSGEGEFAPQGAAEFGVTSSFVAASRSGLPVRDMERVNDGELGNAEGFATPLDQLLTSGLDLNSAALESAVQVMEESELVDAASADHVDEALACVLDEIDVALTVE
jgi:hypothetical protein